MGKLRPCRDCGAMVSRQAFACPSCGRPIKRPAKAMGCGSAVLLIGLALVLLAMFTKTRPGRFVPEPPSPKAVPTPESTRIGDRGTIDATGAAYVWVAVGDDDWNPMLDAENLASGGGEGSSAALRELRDTERIFGCANGSRVFVEKTSITARFIRVLDGTQKGRSGWVQYEFVRKAE